MNTKLSLLPILFAALLPLEARKQKIKNTHKFVFPTLLGVTLAVSYRYRYEIWNSGLTDEQREEAFLQSLDRDDEKTFNFLYARVSEETKLKGIDRVADNGWEYYLPMFENNIKSKALPRSIEADKKESVKWILGKFNYSEDDKITILKDVVMKKKKHFMDLFDEATKLKGIDWLKENKRGNYLSIFDTNSKEKALANAVRDGNVDRAKWLLEKDNYAASTEVKTLKDALSRGMESFLPLFGQATRSRVIYESRDRRDITKFFTSDEILDAWDRREEIIQQQLREGLDCTICRCLLDDPVQSVYGYYYCRGCIVPWVTANSTCPQTRAALYTNQLYRADRDLLNRIDNYRRKYPDDD